MRPPRPVILEVPHFASLRGKEREIVILRSDNGETWREHTLEATEEAVQEVLNESFDGDGASTVEALPVSCYLKYFTKISIIRTFSKHRCIKFVDKLLYAYLNIVQICFSLLCNWKC